MTARMGSGVAGLLKFDGVDARAQAPTLPCMSDRENCLRLLTEFVRTGDIANAASAGAMIVAHLTTLEDRHAQIAALEDLRATLESDFQKADIAGPAEERHVAVEDALDQARKTLAGKPA